MDGSALAPGDYTAKAATVLVFAAGQTSKTVTVQTIDDTIPEPTQYFSLFVTDGVNVRFPNDDFRVIARGDITDNDPLDVLIQSVTFGGGNHTIWSDPDNDPNEDGNTVDARPTRAYSGPHYVDYGNDAGTAAPDGDTTDEQDHRYPVSYTRTVNAATPSYIAASAVVEIRSPIHEYTGPFLIRGRGTDGMDIGALDAQGNLVGIAAASLGGNRYSIPLTQATVALGGVAKFYNTFDVTWEFSASQDNGGQPIYVGAGASHNRMYVTLANPKPLGYNAPLFETVIHLGTTGAEGKSNDDGRDRRRLVQIRNWDGAHECHDG